LTGLPGKAIRSPTALPAWRARQIRLSYAATMKNKPRNEISDRILRHVADRSYRPQRARPLARAMGIQEVEYPAFREAVKTLMRAGRVVLGGGNCISPSPHASGCIEGVFRGHPRGFGFVVPESPAEHGDLFIPPPATLGALTGDRVVARITRRGKGREDARVEGQIVEIIERGSSCFVGELLRQGRDWLVQPDGRVLHEPVYISDIRATRAKAGDQVVIEITEYPSANRPARGVITEILGKHGDPEIDTLSIIRQYHFPAEFPQPALADARAAIAGHDLEHELTRREDLRTETIVTIDPDDARDFDDAISIRTLDSGRFELGVHIADVSAFVRDGGPLDAEAGLRGNSVYFPRHVIPMLPEVLSNGLCSLQEAQNRLTKSVFIEYDTRGQRKKTRFANTVIRSSQRLTYGQATDLIEGRTAGFTSPVVALLQRMDKLARLIRKRRLAAGMVVLDLPEVDLVLNDDDQVIDAAPADTSFSHTIIEMFMVEANEAVAELFTRLGVPHLRRIHPTPPGDAQDKLGRFLRILGHRMPRRITREDMIRLLDKVKGRPESFSVNLALLRSMAQAEYSPKMIGHFALASEHYTHFTSPIRRYPDLIIHRAFDRYLSSGLKSRRDRASMPTADQLATIGKRCSSTERHAEAAERELRQIKILRLLEQRLGDQEDGVVTGVTNVGLFVQLQRYLVDGLLRFEGLADDWWDINVNGGFIRGQRSGRRIAIGDRLRITIAAVNVPERELQLALPAGAIEPARPSTGKQKRQERGKRSHR